MGGGPRGNSRKGQQEPQYEIGGKKGSVEGPKEEQHHPGVGEANPDLQEQFPPVYRGIYQKDKDEDCRRGEEEDNPRPFVQKKGFPKKTIKGVTDLFPERVPGKFAGII
jgi:hypothetical protein